MRFVPSESLANIAITLEQDDNLTRILAPMKPEERVQVMKDVLRSRLSASIQMLGIAERGRNSSDVKIWNKGEFVESVRTHLRTLLEVHDNDEEMYEAFAVQLADEFGKWSIADEAGMSDLHLERDNGTIKAILKGGTHGTKMRHEDKNEIA